MPGATRRVAAGIPTRNVGTRKKLRFVTEKTQEMQLASLNLDYTPVTDARVNELATLRKLTVLSLSGTKVTFAGLRELQKALPKCKISPRQEVGPLD